MKKLTCFICSLSSGGAEHQLITLCDMLANRGYTVKIVTFADIEDHYKLPTSIQRIRIGRNRNMLAKFISIFIFFIKEKTDCIISYGQRENVLCLLPLLFRRKIKVIAGERNYTAGRQSTVEYILFNFLYARADYIVPNSYSQQRHIVSLKKNLKEKVKTIINYTDINEYQPKPAPNNKVPLIGVFCRYAPQKNYIGLGHAIKILKKHIGSTFKFIWYGNQYDKNGEYNNDYLIFKHFIEDNDLQDVFILNNHIKNVSEAMNELDAVCIPSLYEGFSNSISEAICSGKPMLVSDVSDNSVMVKDKINGYLFNPLDYEDIANKVYDFINLNAEQKKQMGQQSRIIAESLFNPNEFISKYIELIEI